MSFVLIFTILTLTEGIIFLNICQNLFICLFIFTFLLFMKMKIYFLMDLMKPNFSLQGVPPENIINFDETNLSDDPGRKKCIFRRGVRYPDRVMNSSKGSVTVMFAGSPSGAMLPPYVVYKAEHLWDTWTEGGPPNTRYNRSKSGWFDSTCFTDWFQTTLLPFLRQKEGPKVIIGDNLSSHFSPEVIDQCQQHEIRFVCLPPSQRT